MMMNIFYVPTGTEVGSNTYPKIEMARREIIASLVIRCVRI